jgi:hypothetical protein
MAEAENVFARWSRLKRQKMAGEPNEDDDTLQRKGTGAATDLAAPNAEAEIDHANLPALESIDEKTNLTAFLARGVPAELRNAALRRAWSVDTAIRDFIGLSENSWDFTKPGGVPGFGSLKAEDVEGMLTRFLKSEGPFAEASVGTDCAAEGSSEPKLPSEPVMPSSSGSEERTLDVGATESGSVEDNRARAAPVPADTVAHAQSEQPKVSLRRHGSASPRFEEN